MVAAPVPATVLRGIAAGHLNAVFSFFFLLWLSQNEGLVTLRFLRPEGPSAF